MFNIFFIFLIFCEISAIQSEVHLYTSQESLGFYNFFNFLGEITLHPSSCRLSNSFMLLFDRSNPSYLYVREVDIYSSIYNLTGGLIHGDFRVNSGGFIGYHARRSCHLLQEEDSSDTVLVIYDSKVQQSPPNHQIFGKIFQINYKTREKVEVESVYVKKSEFVVNDDINTSLIKSHVDVFEDGMFVVVWDLATSVEYHVFGQFFDADGGKFGGAFQITNAHEFNEGPTVVALDKKVDGAQIYVVCYQSHYTGISFGVFCQMYKKPWEKFGAEITVTIDGYDKYPYLTGRSGGKFLVSWESSFEPGKYGKWSHYQILYKEYDGKGNGMGGIRSLPFYRVEDVKGSQASPVVVYSDGSDIEYLFVFIQRIYNTSKGDYLSCTINKKGEVSQEMISDGVRNGPPYLFERHNHLIVTLSNRKYFLIYEYADSGISSLYGRILTVGGKSFDIWDLFIPIVAGAGIFVCVLCVCTVFICVVFGFVLCFFAVRQRKGKIGEKYKRVSKKKHVKLEQIEMGDLTEDERIAAFEQDFLKSSETFQNFKKKLFEENPHLIQNVFKINSEDIKLTKYIASGGGGSVYVGKWKGFDVCYKSFFVGEEFDESSLNDFGKEIGIYLRLSEKHQNVLNLYGFLLQPTKIGLVMEFCKFGDILTFLCKNPYLDMKRRIEICYGITRGLSFLHSKNVLHRDLKPKNILVSDDLVPKLMDFGLSKIVTKTVGVNTVGIGSSKYSSPEQFLGTGEYNAKSDVFSWSITCYEIMTNNFNPFEEGKYDSGNINLRISQDPTFRPKTKKVDFGDFSWFKEVLCRCWEQDPSNRYSSDEIIKIFEENGVKIKVDNEDFNERDPITIYIKLEGASSEESEDFEITKFTMEELKEIVKKKWGFKEFSLKCGEKDVNSIESILEMRNDSVLDVKEEL